MKQLCGLHKPAALMTKVEQDLALGFNDLRKKWHSFFHHAVRCAVAYE